MFIDSQFLSNINKKEKNSKIIFKLCNFIY
jgi:hypothetical protein